ncbi:MAG: helix-turn-helix transcriptional regulator [Myxococcaceae bacterium]|nr:helix-turn-helix transcriptional regulator [Myxococcaceae bacterium]
MALRKIRGQELAERVGISQVNLSKLKTGHVKAIRFSTLEALCAELGCQPGEILEYQPGKSGELRVLDDDEGDD